MPSDFLVDISAVLVAMMTTPRMLVLMILTLRLQSHHTKFLLVNVDTGDKPRSVSKNTNKALPLGDISYTV